MAGLDIHDFKEGEDTILDSFTREQLEQAAVEYNENKQVIPSQC
jgi:hypothetical protein